MDLLYLSEVEMCKPNPCQHGGHCGRVNDHAFNCTCSGMWTGNLCESMCAFLIKTIIHRLHTYLDFHVYLEKLSDVFWWVIRKSSIIKKLSENHRFVFLVEFLSHSSLPEHTYRFPVHKNNHRFSLYPLFKSRRCHFLPDHKIILSLRM